MHKVKKVMKKILGLAIIIMAVSCTQKQDIMDEYVSISFKPTYEGLALCSESVLTKSVEANGIYGINVRECDADYPNQLSLSEKYCYGLFDDIQLLQIKFKRGHRYFIRMDYFPNGKNEIVHDNNNVYELPLKVVPGVDIETVELNKIEYSSSHDIGYLCGFDITHKDYDFGYAGQLLPCDRYMYWNANFVAEDDTAIPVNFLRMNAGITIKFETEDDFDEVQLFYNESSPLYVTTILGNNDEIVVPKIALGVSSWNNGISELYTFNYKIGTADNPSLFFDGDIELKRNTMRTYTIRLQADVTTTPLSVTYEDTPYGEENGGYLN